MAKMFIAAAFVLGLLTVPLAPMAHADDEGFGDTGPDEVYTTGRTPGMGGRGGGYTGYGGGIGGWSGMNGGASFGGGNSSGVADASDDMGNPVANSTYYEHVAPSKPWHEAGKGMTFKTLDPDSKDKTFDRMFDSSWNSQPPVTSSMSTGTFARPNTQSAYSKQALTAYDAATFLDMQQKLLGARHLFVELKQQDKIGTFDAENYQNRLTDMQNRLDNFRGLPKSEQLDASTGLSADIMKLRYDLMDKQAEQ